MDFRLESLDVSYVAPYIFKRICYFFKNYLGIIEIARDLGVNESGSDVLIN